MNEKEALVHAERAHVQITDEAAAILERLLIHGDLSKLSEAERVSYYHELCRTLGLNPLTRPFEYIILNGRLTLYARKDATDQLRRLHGVSVEIAARERVDDLIIITARARTPDGRTDEEIGVVNIKGKHGDDLANALMKATTKAKRRVTLSFCGLGFLDETEIETIPDARPVVAPPQLQPAENSEASASEPAADKAAEMKALRQALIADIEAAGRMLGWSRRIIDQMANRRFEVTDGLDSLTPEYLQQVLDGLTQKLEEKAAHAK
jgi:hypothetical protein